MRLSRALLQTIATRRCALVRIGKLSFILLFASLGLCQKRKSSNIAWKRHEQNINFRQDVRFPLNCKTSVKLVGKTDEFMLKKGWRISCGRGFEIAHETYLTDIYWNHVLFLRPNVVTEGFAPTLTNLVNKTDFEEYRKYGNFAEYALETLFSGKEVKAFLQALKMFESCSLVVVTASFGAQDTLHQALNVEFRPGVCFVAFIDAETRQKYDIGACEESWNVLELPKLLWSDPRIKARMIRALLPFFFPYASFSIWIDSKLQLQEDPVVLVNYHLEKKKAWLAVSENHVRSNIYEEGEKLMKMFHSSLSINETYDKFRMQALHRCLTDYRTYGFSGEGLPDAGLFLRAHTTRALEFSLYWTQEILKYPFGRDQITFPFTVWRYGDSGVNLFNKCWYVQAVREVGHAVRSGVV